MFDIYVIGLVVIDLGIGSFDFGFLNHKDVMLNLFQHPQMEVGERIVCDYFSGVPK
jgi:hypothetical protein